MTLVILAAGLGSRFGGLKQIEPIDNEGNFIIDYSVYDAIKAGFNKIVFVITEEHLKDFKKTIGNRINKLVNVEYVFQNTEEIEKIISIPQSRIKPFGTGHAVYCAKNYVSGPFGVISADDFYGRESFELLYKSLKKGENCTIGYKIRNTMSNYGSVKRGICFTDGDYLVENSDYSLDVDGDSIIGRELLSGKTIKFDENQNVSMLMYGLDKKIFDYMDINFKKFLTSQKDVMNCEYLLPTVLTNMIKDGITRIKVIPTREKWMGITYKEDLEFLKKHINELKEKNIYPKNLYRK